MTEKRTKGHGAYLKNQRRADNTEHLKQALRVLGVTNAELSIAMGVSASAVTGWLQRDYAPLWTVVNCEALMERADKRVAMLAPGVIASGTGEPVPAEPSTVEPEQEGGTAPRRGGVILKKGHSLPGHSLMTEDVADNVILALDIVYNRDVGISEAIRDIMGISSVSEVGIVERAILKTPDGQELDVTPRARASTNKEV